MNPGNGTETIYWLLDSQYVFGRNQMNPGNGTETLNILNQKTTQIQGRNQMNPGNGTETFIQQQI